MVEKTRKGKQRWIKIIGPPELKDSVLGESYVVDPEQLIGKKVYLGLNNLTGDMRRQNILVGFRVHSVKGAEAHADVVSYEMIQAHVKRLIRAGQDKIDDSFLVESKDHVKLRIKPLILTRNKTKNSNLTRIRMRTREKIKDLFTKESFTNTFGAILSGQLQKSLRQDMSKIYPLSVFEIRRVDILNR